MINAEELAICKRRGHDAGHFLEHGWAQCRWCGHWLRQVRAIEEREDAPPEDERSPVGALGRLRSDRDRRSRRQ